MQFEWDGASGDPRRFLFLFLGFGWELLRWLYRFGSCVGSINLALRRLYQFLALFCDSDGESVWASIDFGSFCDLNGSLYGSSALLRWFFGSVAFAVALSIAI